MKTKLVIFIGCLFLLTGMVYVDAAFAATVDGIRLLTHSTSTPSVINGSINIDVDENSTPSGLTINEYIPSDWELNTADPNYNSYDSDTGKISWSFGGELSVEDTTITYNLSVPDGASATDTFSGDLNYNDPANNGVPTVTPIGGHSQVCNPTGLPDNNCDGIDDDCNGFVDDGYAVIQTTCGQGACAGNTGQLECQSGGNVVNTCDPYAGAAADDSVCNGIDDNCDGPVDEDYVPMDTTCGEGVCGSDGQLECQDGQVVDSCTPGVPTEEPEATCNDGLDNDCDGYIDSLDSVDCPDCIQTGLQDDNCDGIDDDCNGFVDDGYVVEQTTCGQGVCTGNTGQFECQSGGNVVNTCDPYAGAAADDFVCNGIDDDCDGSVDEDYVPTVTSCGKGVCGSAGQLQCQDGQVVDSCMLGVPTGDDTDCNGIDENCDGTPDDGYITKSITCGTGICIADGERICENGSPVDICTPGEPNEEGPEETCLDELDNDCDGAVDIIDSDCGPEITVTPERVDFGCVDANGTESIILEITNTGNAVLNTVMAIEDEQFEVVVDNCSGAGIDPNDDPCTVEIAFEPVEEEEADSAVNSTNLTITSADVPEITKNVPLRGTWIVSDEDTDDDCIPASEDVDNNDPTIASPQSAEGTGSITVDASLRLSDVQSFSDDDPVVNQEGNPSGYEFIDGLVSFKVNDVLPAPDDIVTVVITFPTPIPAGAKYFKVDDNGFYEFGADINYADNTVTLTLADAVGTGDRDKGDKDGTLGVIADPGGIASLVAIAEICDDVIDNDLDGDTDCDDSDCAQASNCTTGGGDSSGGGSGSSGKCFITTAAYGSNIADEVMPLIVLVGMIAIGGVVVIRRRK